jgi:outer membrane protein assembly factor BamB
MFDPSMPETSPSLLVVLMACSAIAGFGDDWPHYLGPKHDAAWHEDGVRTELPMGKLKPKWSTAIGGGYSGPAVSKGRVFVMDRIAPPFDPGEVKGNPNFIRAEIPGNERILCLRESDGELIWKHEYDCPYSTAYGYAIGPRCTPTVDGDHVYTLGAEGHLACLRADNGNVVWSKNFKEDLGSKIPWWGCAAHPLVDGNQLICVVGGDGSTVISFDKHTGKENWRALSSKEPGYCPPVIANIHGKRQLLIWHGEAVNGLDPKSGEVFWSAPFKPEYGMSIGAPRVWKDLVFVMGFNRKSGALRVAPDSKSAELAWGLDIRKGGSGVLNTALVDPDGLVYTAGGGKQFRCFDINDGTRIWESEKPLLNADGKTGSWPSCFTTKHTPSGVTFISNDHGELITAKLSRDGYEEISRTKLIEPTHKVGNRLLVWSHPAYANRRIYLRNDMAIQCFDLAK